MSHHPLDAHALPGIGPLRLTRLTEAGITTLEDLLGAPAEQLASLSGFNTTIVDRARAAASAVLAAGPARSVARIELTPDPMPTDPEAPALHEAEGLHPADDAVAPTTPAPRKSRSHGRSRPTAKGDAASTHRDGADAPHGADGAATPIDGVDALVATPSVDDGPADDAAPGDEAAAPESTTNPDRTTPRLKRGLDAARRLEAALEWVGRARDHTEGIPTPRPRKRLRRQLNKLTAVFEHVQHEAIARGASTSASEELVALIERIEQRLRAFTSGAATDGRSNKLRRRVRAVRRDLEHRIR